MVGISTLALSSGKKKTVPKQPTTRPRQTRPMRRRSFDRHNRFSVIRGIFDGDRCCSGNKFSIAIAGKLCGPVDGSKWHNCSAMMVRGVKTVTLTHD